MDVMPYRKGDEYFVSVEPRHHETTGLVTFRLSSVCGGTSFETTVSLEYDDVCGKDAQVFLCNHRNPSNRISWSNKKVDSSFVINVDYPCANKGDLLANYQLIAPALQALLSVVAVDKQTCFFDASPQKSHLEFNQFYNMMTKLDSELWPEKTCSTDVCSKKDILISYKVDRRFVCMFSKCCW